MERKYPQVLANLTVNKDGDDLVFDNFIQSNPEPGTLRLYKANGQYTDYHFDIGDVFLTGRDTAVLRTHLNTRTGADYREGYYRSNIVFPNGVTFEKITNASYMFKSSTNITLPDSVTFESLTTATNMFESAVNLRMSSGAKFEKLVTANLMFYGANNIVIPDDITFASVTNAQQMFRGIVNVNMPANITLEKATNCGYTFSYISGMELALPHHLRLDAATDTQYILRNTKFDGYIPFSFLKPTNMTGFIEDSTPSSAVPDKVIRMPNAICGVVTTGFGNIFWNIARWNAVDMPQATFAKITSGGTTSGTTSKRFRMPKVTWESLTTAFNKNTYPNYYIMPMPDLNLKSLNTGDGMFAKDSLDLVTLRAIANTIKDHSATGGTHNITLGIDINLQNNEEVKSLVAQIRSKGWAVTEQYNDTVEWIYD